MHYVCGHINGLQSVESGIDGAVPAERRQLGTPRFPTDGGGFLGTSAGKE